MNLMHFVEAKGILSAQNGMNIFRGCSHGCIYCDSRSECYQMNHPFTDIEVKENAAVLLEQALIKKRKKVMIGTGAMSDSYIHLEEELLLTQRCLKIIEKYGFGLAIQTKSNRILRDIDLIDRINQKAKAVVQMTLTTFDEKLCKVIEPNVSTTYERFLVLLECKKRKIPTVVWLDPILPFINDTKENLLGILDYCKKAEVKGIICFGFGLTLRKGNREYFYQKLDEFFPGLKQKYIHYYGDSYEVTSPNNLELWGVFNKFCLENGIMNTPEEVFGYLHEFPDKEAYTQLSLF